MFSLVDSKGLGDKCMDLDICIDVFICLLQGIILS